MRVKAANYNQQTAGPVCAAKRQFTSAAVKAGALQASSSNARIWLTAMDYVWDMPVSKAILTGTVAGSKPWQSTTAGLLCGVVTGAAFEDALLVIPADAWVPIGDGEPLRQVLHTIFKPDLDLDGDGIKESISFAFAFETVPVVVTGISP